MADSIRKQNNKLDSEPKKSELAVGGIKKVLYALNTARKIGLKKTSKAMLGKNTCKACGLGMGGQKGGMTNELGEFPSVCSDLPPFSRTYS